MDSFSTNFEIWFLSFRAEVGGEFARLRRPDGHRRYHQQVQLRPPGRLAGQVRAEGGHGLQRHAEPARLEGRAPLRSGLQIFKKSYLYLFVYFCIFILILQRATVTKVLKYHQIIKTSAVSTPIFATKAQIFSINNVFRIS